MTIPCNMDICPKQMAPNWFRHAVAEYVHIRQFLLVPIVASNINCKEMSSFITVAVDVLAYMQRRLTFHRKDGDRPTGK